jgi:hypothetical protein
MKTPRFVSAIVAYALSAPGVSVQETPASTKPARGRVRLAVQMLAHIREMQQQLG